MDYSGYGILPVRWNSEWGKGWQECDEEVAECFGVAIIDDNGNVVAVVATYDAREDAESDAEERL